MKNVFCKKIKKMLTGAGGVGTGTGGVGARRERRSATRSTHARECDLSADLRSTAVRGSAQNGVVCVDVMCVCVCVCVCVLLLHEEAGVHTQGQLALLHACVYTQDQLALPHTRVHTQEQLALPHPE
jgi:hypothetical protein